MSKTTLNATMKDALLERQNHTAQQHAEQTALAWASTEEVAVALVLRQPMLQHHSHEG